MSAHRLRTQYEMAAAAAAAAAEKKEDEEKYSAAGFSFYSNKNGLILFTNRENETHTHTESDERRTKYEKKMWPHTLFPSYFQCKNGLIRFMTM